MAQLVAQRFRNAMVGCSSHSFGVKIKLGLTKVNSFFILYYRKFPLFFVYDSRDRYEMDYILH